MRESAMPLTIKFGQHEGWELLGLAGSIDEDAEIQFDQVKSKLSEKIIFDFRSVTLINSCGVRSWINFLREIQGNRQIRFQHCTPDVISQINMIPNFLGKARVDSLYADYSCNSCGHQTKFFFEKGKNLPDSSSNLALPEVKCEQCGEPMEMDEMEEEFFSFLDAA
jgi:anti-anti-sigma regulatory factor/DNA-directed RNA polymerase subunit RPC12/RpoP